MYEMEAKDVFKDETQLKMVQQIINGCADKGK